MGMGDSPKKSNYRRTTVCNKCGLELTSCSVRSCPHPAVQTKIGKNICIYCCRKCSFHITYPMNGMVGCGYKEDVK